MQERDLVQEMRDGAIDGLSAADLEAAGEQIRRLSSYVFRAIENLRSSAAKVGWPPTPLHAATCTVTIAVSARQHSCHWHTLNAWASMGRLA